MLCDLSLAGERLRMWPLIHNTDKIFSDPCGTHVRCAIERESVLLFALARLETPNGAKWVRSMFWPLPVLSCWLEFFGVGMSISSRMQCT